MVTVQHSYPDVSWIWLGGSAGLFGSSLGLTIHLWEECGQQNMIYTEVDAFSDAELTSELIAAIGSNMTWYTAFGDDVFEYYSC